MGGTTPVYLKVCSRGLPPDAVSSAARDQHHRDVHDGPVAVTTAAAWLETFGQLWPDGRRTVVDEFRAA